jgi:hypothetical protein
MTSLAELIRSLCRSPIRGRKIDDPTDGTSPSSLTDEERRRIKAAAERGMRRSFLKRAGRPD